MRIVQIIDSLEVGGAERMALNYANALSEKIEFSGLIASRKEGLLLSQIDEKVSYLFLKKKKIIDFKAVFLLRRYLKNNKVSVIHAHSSSFFIAVLVKLTLPKIKIIWHDHYGISQDLKSRKNVALKFGSLFFKGSIAVNTALKDWAESYLYCKNVIYFPNFVDEITNLNKEVSLNGEEGKRIVCVANLRPQKNHELLIKAANIIRNEYPDWTFHLFGKDFLDDHSKKLKELVRDLELDKNIFFYGAVNNVASVLEQCNIAVLPSISEGLPLAILEYGLYKLPVVATNVGEISTIIISEKEGLIIESNNINQFSQSIQKLIRNKKSRIEMGLELNKIVNLNYSQESIVRDYISWLNYLINFIPSKNI
ncbi:glycosyltransferase [Flavobacterium sp. LS1R47]|uniref:Glycosyltransferase n=1 Tax=Flavobacterium frigoritolerans TaxID=2987686 RepID=A0A9X2ZH00_9FLAO|nr:glycosyltransferase [Flavobacterium frigoritolerans]MCV9931231.1 glycosyltransferase [Flavobacterium frigoritolerans]